MSPMTFMIVGFLFFVGSVLFYLWTDERNFKADVSVIKQTRVEVLKLKNDLTENEKTTKFLMTERNKMHLQNEELRGELEKLQDLNAANIST